MRQVLCPVLVGREEELRVLLEALDGTAAGRGTTTVVVGEAGGGKSRLVRELSGVARGRALPVLTGRAAAGAVPVPFRPLAEAVLGELRRGELPDLPELRPFRPALGRLVPEWRPREPLGGAGSLVVLGEGVLRLLRALAAEVGAVALVATLDLQIGAGLVKQFRPGEALGFLADSAAASHRFHLATLPMALVYQGTAHAQRDEGTAMEGRLAEALALAPDDSDVNGCAWGHCRATLSLLAENRPRARAEMATGARFLQRSPATVAAPFLGLHVLLAAVEGDGDAALAEAGRVRGTGATRHRIVGSLLGYAEAALADGWGEPVAWLREAAGFFAARGDDRIAAACRALLRRAGAPVPRAGRGDAVVPPGLRAIGVTSREADVLALVAEGLTNVEIGGRLHLSPRTVEKHVASLLAKTGGRRRTQLAKYAAALTR